MRLIRRRPSPAMVVALIALFVALGGPAQAKRVIDGASIRRGTITTKQIKNGSVAKADLSKAAVHSLTATPASSVGSAQLVDGQVLAPDLGAGSVGQAQLAPDSIGGGSVANGSLQTVDIGSFTGSVNVDFGQFDNDQNRCQKAEAPAAPTGGSPNIADDVVVVSPPSGWSDFLIVTGKPAPGNVIRIVACWSAPASATQADFPNPPLT